MGLRRVMLFTLGAKIKNLVQAFKTRVLGDGSLFEAESCLETQLNVINDEGLLDSASLVITPNGYEENVLYSVIPNDGTTDLTFTRATTAIRVNNNHLVEFVPYNIFSRSEEFENGYWTKQGTSVTSNSIEAPDGTMTADSIIGTSGRAYAYNGGVATNIVSSALTNRNEVTVSFYLKYKGLNRIRVMYGNATSINTYRYITVDLENGSLIDNSANITNPFIKLVEGGWYRVGFSSIMNVGTTNNRFAIGLGDTTKTTGDDVDGVYMWGAQLVNGNQAKEYFRVTNGFNIPRLDYSNGCPSILIEPQMTNSWTNNNATAGYTSNTNAIKGATISNAFGEGFDGFEYNFIGGASFIASSTNIRVFDTRNLPVQRLCLYVKAPSSDFFGIHYTNVGQVIYKFSTLEVSDSTIGAIKKINSDTYALYIHTNTAVTGQFSQVRIAFVTSLTNDDNIDGSAILGLAYYQGAATGTVGLQNYNYTPIITGAGAVTRNADVISKVNAIDLIGQTEGTIFVDYNKVLANDAPRNIISLNDGSIANMIEIWDGVGSSNLGRIIYTYFADNIPKASGWGQSTISPSGRYKICITYLRTPSLVNFKIFINGVKLDDRNFTYTAFSNPLSRINIGNRNGTGVGVGSHNLDFILKTRISDTEAINLTTL